MLKIFHSTRHERAISPKANECPGDIQEREPLADGVPRHSGATVSIFNLPTSGMATKYGKFSSQDVEFII